MALLKSSQVAICEHQEFTDQKRLSMTMKEYMEYWKSLNRSDSKGNADLNAHSIDSLLYLKDWHFVKECPNYSAYEVPQYFKEDWLNDYLDFDVLHKDDTHPEQQGSDYRFLYMGPKGTWTPLHADVLQSFSWSANICGRKLWLLLPPDQSSLLLNKHGNKTLYRLDVEVSCNEFPNYSKTEWVECIQEEGEIIFVPSGSFHQVWNLEDTISINHNWLNGCNLHWAWQLLQEDYKQTVQSIEDVRNICDDFEAICQRNLAANSGMNFEDFLRFLTVMAAKQIQRLKRFESGQGKIHEGEQLEIIFNLCQIKSTAEKIPLSVACEMSDVRFSLTLANIHGEDDLLFFSRIHQESCSAQQFSSQDFIISLNILLDKLGLDGVDSRIPTVANLMNSWDFTN